MNATIYIREENEDEWKQIANKSEWVNDLLGKRFKQVKVVEGPYSRAILSESGEVDPEQLKNISVPQAEGVVISSTPVGPNPFIRAKQEEKGIEFCKHDQVKGFCKKGCK